MDTIVSSSEFSILVGGADEDALTAFSSHNVIVGYGATVAFMDNKVHEIQTLNSEYDANDVIVASDGTQVIFGGAGADSITVGNGTNTIFGDNGLAVFNSSTQLTLAESLDAEIGAADTFSLGNGFNRVVAGAGNE